MHSVKLSSAVTLEVEDLTSTYFDSPDLTHLRACPSSIPDEKHDSMLGLIEPSYEAFYTKWMLNMLERRKSCASNEYIVFTLMARHSLSVWNKAWDDLELRAVLRKQRDHPLHEDGVTLATKQGRKLLEEVERGLRIPDLRFTSILARTMESHELYFGGGGGGSSGDETCPPIYAIDDFRELGHGDAADLRHPLSQKQGTYPSLIVLDTTLELDDFRERYPDTEGRREGWESFKGRITKGLSVWWDTLRSAAEEKHSNIPGPSIDATLTTHCFTIHALYQALTGEDHTRYLQGQIKPLVLSIREIRTAESDVGETTETEKASREESA